MTGSCFGSAGRCRKAGNVSQRSARSVSIHKEGALLPRRMTGPGECRESFVTLASSSFCLVRQFFASAAIAPPAPHGTRAARAPSLATDRPSPRAVLQAGANHISSPLMPGRGTVTGDPHARVGDRIGWARTRLVLGTRRQPAADKTVVRAGQSRHRPGRRMRPDRRARLPGAGCLRAGQRDRPCGARTGGAAGRRHHRRHGGRRHRLLRAIARSGATRRQQDLHQGALRRRRHPHRAVGALRRRRSGARIRPPPRRADRGEGRRAGGRQGRRGRRLPKPRRWPRSTP